MTELCLFLMRRSFVISYAAVRMRSRRIKNWGHRYMRCLREWFSMCVWNNLLLENSAALYSLLCFSYDGSNTRLKLKWYTYH